MSSIHLPLIQGMYPGKLVLNINEIATVINTTPSNIYTLIRDKNLPFALLGTTKKIEVLVVELAQYLDNLYSKSKAQNEEEVVGVVVHKRRGRPRKQPLQDPSMVSAFQTQLAFAVSQQKAQSLIGELEDRLSGFHYSDDKRACVEKYNELKDNLSFAIASARTKMEAFSLNVWLEQKEVAPKKSVKV